MGLIPGSGRSPGGGHGNPFQHSCLENPMDRGAWQATVHRFTELNTTEATQHTSQYDEFSLKILEVIPNVILTFLCTKK